MCLRTCCNKQRQNRNNKQAEIFEFFRRLKPTGAEFSALSLRSIKYQTERFDRFVVSYEAKVTAIPEKQFTSHNR